MPPPRVPLDNALYTKWLRAIILGSKVMLVFPIVNEVPVVAFPVSQRNNAKGRTISTQAPSFSSCPSPDSHGFSKWTDTPNELCTTLERAFDIYEQTGLLLPVSQRT